MGSYCSFLYHKLLTIKNHAFGHITASSAYTESLCPTFDRQRFYSEKYQGEGIGIAVLDTGISPVDDFILPYNRIVAFQDFVNGRKGPYDDNGHGTHVT